MLNNHHFFSFIIIINSYPKYLENLLTIIIKQCTSLKKYQIILINNNQDIKVINSCLDSLKIYHNIEIINFNQNINDTYKNIFNIVKGEILVFTKVNYYPDNYWLENIINSFDNDHINIVAGEVCQVKEQNILNKLSSLIKQLINRNKFNWNNIFDEQISNIAVKKEFIKQQKSLYLPSVNSEEISLYYRILTEIESEIIYNPSVVVYEQK